MSCRVTSLRVSYIFVNNTISAAREGVEDSLCSAILLIKRSHLIKQMDPYL